MKLFKAHVSNYDEEDRKAHITRDKRIKLIGKAIRRLKYIKT